METRIDEIQRVPDLLSWIQVRVDQVQAPGQFILTGSHEFDLMPACPARPRGNLFENLVGIEFVKHAEWRGRWSCA